MTPRDNFRLSLCILFLLNLSLFFRGDAIMRLNCCHRLLFMYAFSKINLKQPQTTFPNWFSVIMDLSFCHQVCLLKCQIPRMSLHHPTIQPAWHHVFSSHDKNARGLAGLISARHLGCHSMSWCHAALVLPYFPSMTRSCQHAKLVQACHYGTQGSQ